MSSLQTLTPGCSLLQQRLPWMKFTLPVLTKQLSKSICPSFCVNSIASSLYNSLCWRDPSTESIPVGSSKSGNESQSWTPQCILLGGVLIRLDAVWRGSMFWNIQFKAVRDSPKIISTRLNLKFLSIIMKYNFNKCGADKMLGTIKFECIFFFIQLVSSSQDRWDLILVSALMLTSFSKWNSGWSHSSFHHPDSADWCFYTTF